MDLHAACAALEAAAGDPRDGLPADLFRLVSRLTPLVNVDLLIQDEGRTLLTWRDDAFFGPGWHIPGGIIRYKESAVTRVQACAREELGADVFCDADPLFVAETIRAQDTRGHAVALLFRCRLLSAPDQARRAATDPPSAGQWRWHDGCPPDLLDIQRPYARFFS